jgi:hypothetical protein
MALPLTVTLPAGPNGIPRKHLEPQFVTQLLILGALAGLRGEAAAEPVGDMTSFIFHSTHTVNISMPQRSKYDVVYCIFDHLVKPQSPF